MNFISDDPVRRAQEIFDHVCRHLAAQGRRAMNDGSCAYRAPDGSRCAVGCLIEDSDYDPMMEGVVVTGIRPKGIQLDPALLEHVDLLFDLQACHDESSAESFALPRGSFRFTADVPSIRDRLLLVAGAHRLNPTILLGLRFPEVWR